jgi:hypothetical protein
MHIHTSELALVLNISKTKRLRGKGRRGKEKEKKTNRDREKVHIVISSGSWILDLERSIFTGQWKAPPLDVFTENVFRAAFRGICYPQEALPYWVLYRYQ